MDSFASRRSDRLAGAVLALLLQLGFFALLLSSRPLLAPPEKLVRELTLILPRLREPAPPSPPAPLQQSSRPLQAPVPQVVLPPNPNAPTAAPLDFNKLGQSIFGCAPENWSSLTPENRALCPRPGEGVTVRESPNLMGLPSQSKDEAHWHHEWVRKESPLLLPGASPGKFGITLMATGGTPSLLGGSDDSAPLYDIPEPAPEDFYKRERDSDAWNKAHGGK